MILQQGCDIRPSAKLQWVATLPYTLCDAEIPVLCDPANITFTVTAVNDAPMVIMVPILHNRRQSTVGGDNRCGR
jgi:hypothetical protein